MWHGLKVPYTDLFAWLDGKARAARYRPVGAVPSADAVAIRSTRKRTSASSIRRIFRPSGSGTASGCSWCWARARCRCFRAPATISPRPFPILSRMCSGEAVLDGELLVGQGFRAGSVQRPAAAAEPARWRSPSISRTCPAFIRVYDMLFDGREDIRTLTWTERRARLEAWFAANPQTRLDLSRGAAVRRLGRPGRACGGRAPTSTGMKGVMIKLRSLALCAGAAQGLLVQVEARSQCGRCRADVCAARARQALVVLFGLHVRGVEGQRDRADRQGLFRLHRRGAEAARQVDAQQYRCQAFGPVREVRKELVFEVAFDSAQESTRHKSGVALRFPRINRIRWDKPASEAATLEDMQVFLERHLRPDMSARRHRRARSSRSKAQMAAAAEARISRRRPRLRNEIARLKGGSRDAGASASRRRAQMGLGTQVPVRAAAQGLDAAEEAGSDDECEAAEALASR